MNKYFAEPVDIIDLGCGSGVIGLTLEKKISTKSVDLIDISKKALEVTKVNKENLKSNANLYQNDFLKNIEKKYDVIISNPPYIKNNEQIEQIGLDCYESILRDAGKNLKERAIIAFEIGYTQAEDIKTLASKYLDNIRIEVKKDLSEKDRMLFIFKNIE